MFMYYSCPENKLAVKFPRFMYTLPRRLAGFLLKSARNKLCTSGLRNCGIPSLALYRQHKRQAYAHAHLVML